MPGVWYFLPSDVWKTAVLGTTTPFSLELAKGERSRMPAAQELHAIQYTASTLLLTGARCFSHGVPSDTRDRPPQ